ncbi:PadR family transcriptional regulator [Paractinoplanes toevensis]|uniref:PadR family transcriptional regulator n=1 Tax=Paractinoplanes toevensis TaxID=571911 RepID=A0A919VZL8_9ACTN|nr:PadR family transcriptional regulator [Actinoplanes toevensis]GIM90257.1 PadR family transcriptional regulator [Actinoplanes toevensis]
MAKRRKVGNPMALGVLSVVAFREMHPYEMAAALKGWGKDRDLQIKWGSLYTVVGNLAKHGLIAEVGSVRAGKRPERTVYRITDAGRAELIDWTRELLSTAEPEFPRFRTGLSVLPVLAPDEVIALLQQRLDAVGRGIEATVATLASEQVPRLFLIEVEYDLAMLRAEAAWMRSLLDELETGTLPGIDDWRRFHETGEPPDEIRQLAEDAIENR